jgi:hypothetical protein
MRLRAMAIPLEDSRNRQIREAATWRTLVRNQEFSFPRPVVQGARTDRDMHGAQWAVLLAELDLRS